MLRRGARAGAAPAGRVKAPMRERRAMAYEQLTQLNLNTVEVGPDDLARRIDQLLNLHTARYRRLWMYYRNPMLPRTIERDEQGSDRPYRQAQEWGLPSRVTGVRAPSSGAALLS